MPALHQLIDILWTCDGEVCAGDLKTVEDFIASYTDGRLHAQVTAMQQMACRFAFILIEGDAWSADGGHTVGDPRFNSWTWDQFDDAVFDLQLYGGVKIVRSPSKDRTARRLAALWRWSAKDEAASWHSPVPIRPASDFNDPTGVIFYDDRYRNRVGALMHIDGWGVKLADQVLGNLSFAEAVGATPEGLAAAEARLAQIKGMGPKKLKAWKEFITECQECNCHARRDPAGGKSGVPGKYDLMVGHSHDL